MRIGSNTYWLGYKPCISPLVDECHSGSFGMRILGCNQDSVRRFCLGMAQRLDSRR